MGTSNPKDTICTAHTVGHDNHQSPMEMLLGRTPRKPYQVYQTPVLTRANDSNTRLLALRHRQKVRYDKQQGKDNPKRPYQMKIQQCQPGDWVRIKSDKPHGEALQRGVPVKWVFRWNDKGTIIGPVENHPDQYYVRKAKTGRTIKRSGKSLSKIPVPDDQEQVDQEPPQLEENDIGENWNINHLFM